MARIEYAPDQPPSLLARWGSRLGLFCLVLLTVTFVLHRLFSLPTPVAVHIAIAAFAGAALVVAMAAVAGLDIWVTGRQGAARVIVGAILGLGLLAVPAALWLMSREWPEINDITTDTEHPPEYVDIAKLRTGSANPLKYPAGQFRTAQIAAYPDLKTLVLPRSGIESFDLVLQALGKLKLKILSEEPPDTRTGEDGTVEVVDKTLILGFDDDVVIRVKGDDKSSRIDVRSSSRYGRSDFGRNAERVRHVLKEIVGRFEASVPNAARLHDPRAGIIDKKLKRPLMHGPGSAAHRSRQDPSRSDARREPGQKGSPQGREEGKSPGKPRGQADE
jgi:hypothetical protein